MYKFFKSAWSTFRAQRFWVPSTNISGRISEWFKSASSNFNILGRTSSRQYSSSSSKGASAATHGMRLAFLSLFVPKPPTDQYKNAYEVEKTISEMVVAAETLVIEDKLGEAKATLNEALKLAEETSVFSNVSSVYDLLSTIAFREGGITEAEDMLVSFIEKLIQLGYPESHNSIVRFKLKLSRLYQSVGNQNMAELGFRDCINTQEEKMARNKMPDELTSLIYVSSLFWYGRFLIENGEFQKAKGILKKALNSLSHAKSVSPAQVMVVLYYNAEIAYILKEYDDSLHYLYQAIHICKENDPGNQDLPLYLVKVGYIHIVKGLYSEAKFWCETASKLAKLSGNEDSVTEANLCMETLDKMTKDPKLAAKETMELI